MEENEVKIKRESLQQLLQIVKDIQLQNIAEKPNMDEAHEASESPELEAAEHASDMELSEEGTKVEESEESEEALDDFVERKRKNLYKGGKAKSAMIGVAIAAPSKGRK